MEEPESRKSEFSTSLQGQGLDLNNGGGGLVGYDANNATNTNFAFL
jgi:hypothetical protein